MAILPAISSCPLRTHSVLRLRAWGPLPPPIWTQSLEPSSFLPTNPLRSDCPPHFHGYCSSLWGPFLQSPRSCHPAVGSFLNSPAALQSLPTASLLMFAGFPAPPATLPRCLPPHSWVVHTLVPSQSIFCHAFAYPSPPTTNLLPFWHPGRALTYF